MGKGTTVVVILGAGIAGYLIADYMALNMANIHGVIKYGGLFNNQPKPSISTN